LCVFDVSSVFGDESRVLDGDSVEFKVEENMNGNGNKEKKTSQKISTVTLFYHKRRIRPHAFRIVASGRESVDKQY